MVEKPWSTGTDDDTSEKPAIHGEVVTLKSDEITPANEDTAPKPTTGQLLQVVKQTEQDFEWYPTQAYWFSVGVATATSRDRMKKQQAQEVFAQVMGFDSSFDLRETCKRNDRHDSDLSHAHGSYFPSYLVQQDVFSARVTAQLNVSETAASDIVKFFTTLGRTSIGPQWQEAALTCFMKTQDLDHLQLYHGDMYVDDVIFALESLNGIVSKKARYRMLAIMALTHWLKQSEVISRVTMSLIWSALQPSNYSALHQLADKNQLETLGGLAKHTFFYHKAMDFFDKDIELKRGAVDVIHEWQPLFGRLLRKQFYLTEFGVLFRGGVTLHDDGFFKAGLENTEKRFLSGIVIALENTLPESLSPLFIEDENLRHFCRYDLIKEYVDFDAPDASKRLSYIEQWCEGLRFFYPKRPRQMGGMENILTCFSDEAKPEHVWMNAHYSRL